MRDYGMETVVLYSHRALDDQKLTALQRYLGNLVYSTDQLSFIQDNNHGQSTEPDSVDSDALVRGRALLSDPSEGEDRPQLFDSAYCMEYR
jgi:hypothetical protein